MLARLLLFGIAAGLAGCDGDSAVSWEDLGQLPVGKGVFTASHAPMAVAGDDVLVGTADGVWRRSLDAAGNWERAGLDGVEVRFVKGDSHNTERLYAGGRNATANPALVPFFVSSDGGASWTPSRIGVPDIDGGFADYSDLVVRPDKPDQLYANMSGPSVNVSTDGGDTWQLANGESETFIGSPCHLHFLVARPDRLYQGCESPLDVAWVGQYLLDDAEPARIGDIQILVGAHLPGLEDLQNRRPNSIASGAARPDTLYVGVEAGLFAYDVQSGDVHWLHRIESDSPTTDNLQPAYIQGIWLDPGERAHLIFGGGNNGFDPVLSLHETFDHGVTLNSIAPPRALISPEVQQLLALPDGDILVLISEEGSTGLGRDLSLFRLRRS